VENSPVLKNTCYREVKYVFVVSEAMNKTEDESENLHRQLLDREIDVGAFVQKYKKLRTTYHKRALIHLAAKTSSTG
jgi:ESCRT-I complex subunit VPS37